MLTHAGHPDCQAGIRLLRLQLVWSRVSEGWIVTYAAGLAANMRSDMIAAASGP